MNDTYVMATKEDEGKKMDDDSSSDEVDTESDTNEPTTSKNLAPILMKELKSKKKPAYIDMIVEAIIKIDDKPGASVKAITTSIVQMYSLNTDKIKKYVKHALEKGLTDEILIRPKKAGHAEPKGVLTGRYKVNPTYLKKNKAANKKKQVKKKTAPKEKKEKLPSAKSLKDKPYSVQLAKDKLKQARMSLNISPSPMAVKHRKRKMAEKISSTSKNTTKPSSASPTKKKIPAKKAKTKVSTEDKKSPTKKSKGSTKTVKTKPKAKTTNPKENEKQKASKIKKSKPPEDDKSKVAAKPKATKKK